MNVEVVYRGCGPEPSEAAENGDPIPAPDCLRDVLLAAAIAWNQGSGNELLNDGVNEVEHYRLIVDFSVRRPPPVAVVD